MDMVNRVRVIAAAFVLARLVLAQATAIFEHPLDATVEPNVWANFSCTVYCSLPVKWYKVGHSYPIETKSIDDLEFKTPLNSTCTSENKTIYFLEVLATKKFHNSAFYCAAYDTCFGCPETECRCGCDGRCYSRPAFLRVETVPTLSTSHPTPTPSHTLQGTVTHEATTKTVTITTTPTNCPTSAVVTGSTPLLLETSSSQASSAQATFLAGLGIAASIFLL